MNSDRDCCCSNLTSNEIAVRIKSYVQYFILKLAKTTHLGVLPNPNVRFACPAYSSWRSDIFGNLREKLGSYFSFDEDDSCARLLSKIYRRLFLNSRLHMCWGVSLLARPVHMHVRWRHIRTVRVWAIIRRRCRRRGRVWGRHKHRTRIVCQHGRGGEILTVCQWSRCRAVPHVIHVRTAAWELVRWRTWFLLLNFWRRNCSRRGFLLKFSFVFGGFVKLTALGSSVLKPHLKWYKYNRSQSCWLLNQASKNLR